MQPTRSPTPATSPRQGQELHLPVHGRRRQPDGYVRVQARAVEIRRPADAARRERTVGEIATFSAAPNRIIPPSWEFKQHGQSGRWMSDLLPNLATRVDDLAFIHGIKVDNNNHGPAVYHTLTGNPVSGQRIDRRVGHLRARQRESGSARLHRDGRSPRRDHRRRGCLGQRISAGGLSGHAVPQRRYADRRPEPAPRQ